MIAIYDRIGDKYDTTRRADPSILNNLASLLGINERNKYLDVACGTGNYTSEIAKIGGSWYALDHSEKMLQEAQNKSNLVKWNQFDIEKLGYGSDMFHGAICSLAIHHFPNLGLAFSEVARVLKSDSNFIIFTATPEQMRTYWLCHYFPIMIEKSCEQMPTLRQIEKSLSGTELSINSLKQFFITPDLEDFFLYSGKQRPEMYLSEKVRNGISSFHNFCTPAELESGLTKLQADIESGQILEIISQYQSSTGDYLFIQVKKANKANAHGKI